jgi:hypothetical protein
MGTVGLLYVGAVLFLNGLMLLGRVEPKTAGVFNLFVGTLQVVLPTILLITADSDPALITGAAPLYLFGFTYLYVGINLLTGADGSGLGWFSSFVAVMAVGFAGYTFRQLEDAAFGVIWLYWAFLWGLFWALLALRREEITAYTGWVAIIEGWVTAAIPAFLILTGYWQHTGTIAVVLAVGGAVAFVALWPVTRRRPAPGGGAADVEVPASRAADPPRVSAS